MRDAAYLSRSDAVACIMRKRGALRRRTLSTWACSSAGRAPRSQRGGQRFDPAQVHHLFFSSYRDRSGSGRAVADSASATAVIRGQVPSGLERKNLPAPSGQNGVDGLPQAVRKRKKAGVRFPGELTKHTTITG